ncbi:MAG: hypothetical protein HY289_16915 [Planctomycetes bacterium]|nr:hypothetical protein [Planctomycetota bacterium]
MRAFNVTRIVAIVAATLLLPVLAFGQESLAIKAPFPNGLFLVRAKINDVTTAGKATLTIEHVYAGPDNLKGRKFEASTSTPRIGSSIGPEPGRYIWHLQKHAEGLWWLKKAPHPGLNIGPDGKVRPFTHDPEKLEPVLDQHTLKIYRIEAFPYQRDRFVGDYEEGLKWAEAVEDVYRAPSDEARGIKIERLTARARPPIADWATAVLVAQYSHLLPAWPNGVKFETTDEAKNLRPRADNKKLSPDARITLDRMLAQLFPHDWSKAADREGLLSRCFTTDNRDDIDAACNHLLDSLAARELDFEVYAKVLDPVLATGAKLPAVSQWSLGRSLREPRWETEHTGYLDLMGRARGTAPVLDSHARAKLVAQHFAWLKKHLKDAKSPILRVHAAAGFKAISPISDDDAAELRKLCGKDAIAKRELDYALDVRIWREDDGAARRAAHFLGEGMRHPNGPYHIGYPFYTGGIPLARGKKVELPMIKDLAEMRRRMSTAFPGGITDQVTRCKLWDLRAALTPDPQLKLLAEQVTNDKSLLYVVHLHQPHRTDDLALLVRVERGTGSVVGLLGAMGTYRSVTEHEKQLRQTAADFVKAYNRKAKDELDPLLGPAWCHGGYHFYKMADGSKPTYPPEIDIGPYGKPSRPWTGGATTRGLAATLPTEITSVVRYEDQRRVLIADPKGLLALDKHMGQAGYVAVLGARPDSSTTLLLTIEKGRTKVVGTLSGLCGLPGKD